MVGFYEAGGRLTEAGPNRGDGRLNPHKSGFVQGFELTGRERADLVAFLESLTDPELLTDEALSNPFATR